MITGWNIFPYFALVAALVGVVAAVFSAKSKSHSVVAQLLAYLSTAVVGLFIVLLWVELERPPLRTMGETRLWYSFFLFAAGAFTYARWHYRWILSFSTLLATVFMVINVVKPEIHDSSLMPALQSVWFIPHVSIYMFSYALLGCATLLSIYSLFCRQSVEEAVDKLLYGGIAFLTVGMLTGALWAKEAWGEYWSWDAKESWAAATWLLYLLVIHLRRFGKGYGRGMCLLIVIAFLALQMCWYGVNYLPSAAESVHTYNR